MCMLSSCPCLSNLHCRERPVCMHTRLNVTDSTE
jgi:hypothetical protein